MNTPIRTKLFLTIVGVTIPALVLIGVLSYLGGKATVERTTLEHLTSVRAQKARQIEGYFDLIQTQARAMAQDRTVIEAMIDFDTAFQELETVEVTREQQEAVASYYRDEFLPRLQAHTDSRIEPTSLLPAENAELHLQHEYIVANPSPVGEKYLLDDTGEGSVYSEVHSLVHPFLRDFARQFGYHDLMLISGDGRAVYTVEKEVDLGTDLIDGPYRDSNLAKVFLEVQRDFSDGRVRVVDFAQYAPSFGEPEAFVAAPIVDADRLLGALVLQMPIGEIDRVMTDDQEWLSQGLGTTGETYLVGPDRRLRSNSRFFLEDPESYFAQLEKAGATEIDLRRIRTFDTSILLQQVDSRAVREALDGLTATTITTDYRGEEVLSSFEPLDLQDLDWVVLAERDASEAFASIRKLARNTVLAGAILALVVLILSWVAARRFVRPILELEEAASRFAGGDQSIRLEVRSEDELGRLTGTFNRMIASIRRQTAELTRNNEELQGVKSVILRWGPDGVIRFINDFGCVHFGFSAAELVGQGMLGTIVEDTEEARASIQKMIDEIANDPLMYETDESENRDRKSVV